MPGLPRHSAALNTATRRNLKALDFESIGENAAGVSGGLKNFFMSASRTDRRVKRGMTINKALT